MTKIKLLDHVEILRITHLRYYPVTVMTALFIAQVFSVLLMWVSIFGCTIFLELEILGYLMWPLGMWVVMTAGQFAALKITEYRVWTHALLYVVSYLIMIPVYYRISYNLLGILTFTLIHFGFSALLLTQYHILLNDQRKRDRLKKILLGCAMLYAMCLVMEDVWANILWSNR